MGRIKKEKPEIRKTTLKILKKFLSSDFHKYKESMYHKPQEMKDIEKEILEGLPKKLKPKCFEEIKQSLKKQKKSCTPASIIQEYLKEQKEGFDIYEEVFMKKRIKSKEKPSHDGWHVFGYFEEKRDDYKCPYPLNKNRYLHYPKKLFERATFKYYGKKTKLKKTPLIRLRKTNDVFNRIYSLLAENGYLATLFYSDYYKSFMEDPERSYELNKEIIELLKLKDENKRFLYAYERTFPDFYFYLKNEEFKKSFEKFSYLLPQNDEAKLRQIAIFTLLNPMRAIFFKNDYDDYNEILNNQIPDEKTAYFQEVYEKIFIKKLNKKYRRHLKKLRLSI